jgi:hypothetical protein
MVVTAAEEVFAEEHLAADRDAADGAVSVVLTFGIAPTLLLLRLLQYRQGSRLEVHGVGNCKVSRGVTHRVYR